MQPFEKLTARGQAQRLGATARSVLDDYGLEGAKLQLIRNWQNATFRVDVPSKVSASRITDPFMPGRYLLRISRSDERTASQTEGELRWLSALHQLGEVTVPKPVRTLDGGSCVVLSNRDHPGLDGGEGATRVAALLHWMPGRMARRKGRRLHHIHRLGKTMAKLHRHAEGWRAGLKLDRWEWDCDAIMGRSAGIGIEPDVWDELPPDEHDLFSESEDRLRVAIGELGHGAAVHGMIHADLHFANVLFAGGEARPIDFDDCGPGHYLYDLAATLMGFDAEPGTTTWRDAFVAGYRTERPLDDEHLAYLNAFIAARESTLLLWCRTSARTREVFRDALPRWNARALPEIRHRLDA